MAVTKKAANGIPTIDVSLVVVRTTAVEIAVDTANKIAVEAQTEESDAIKLVKLGKLIAQKPATTTITGHTITLTDNVFIPDVVKIFQGGTVGDSSDGYPTYEPPAAGSTDKGEVFDLDCYSAVYDSSGQIVKYELITYPNCQGTPVVLNSEDDVFRLPEYTINSAPKKGQPPYKISYVDELPTGFATESDTGTRSAEQNSPIVMSGRSSTEVSKLD